MRVLLFATALCFLPLLLGGCDSSGVAQPVSFNHKAHLDKGLQCAFCHQYVQKADFAGIPPLKVCATCHRGKISNSTEADKVRTFVKERKEIPWQRIYRMPSYVYFSHRRHVSLGRLQCETCHGDLRQSTTPQLRPAVALTMNTCIACHDKRKVRAECLACHH